MAADTSAGRPVPSRSVPTVASSATGERLTIGKVLAVLGEEFPDVSASKIRFLEAEGLVTPERTAAGYRTYSTDDVVRLRYILAAQRDRYWPLKVIREALDALDRGLDDGGGTDGRPKPPSPTVDPRVPSAAELMRRSDISLTGPELREASGLDRSSFHALEGFGLIQPGPDGHYGEEALAVAAAAVALAQYGLEPRHLRPFRTAADREIGLVDQLLATRRGEHTRDERAAEVLSACIALHVALVRAGLAR